MSDAAAFLIEPGELAKRNFLILDCRGKNDYLQGHIPGAVNLSASELIDPDSPRGALCDPEIIRELFSRAGLDGSTDWVVYDDAGLVPSARVFWLCELLGFTPPRLLNGGFPGWKGAGLPLETGEQGIISADSLSYSGRDTEDSGPPLNTRVLATKEDILRGLERGADQEPGRSQGPGLGRDREPGQGGLRIIDARSEGEYTGQIPNARRNGHIPAAVNINWELHLQNLLLPRLKPLPELEALYRNAGVNQDDDIVVYCRSGARSSHSYFVLSMLGHSKVRNYSASWLEWGNEDDTPVET